MNGIAVRAVAAATILACAGSAEAAPACPAVSSGSFATNVIRSFRVYTDPATGDSALTRAELPAKLTPLLKTGKILKEFNLGAAKRVQVVVAPPDLELPLHPAPYPESFVVLAGSTELRVADGSKVDLEPGDMVTFDDTASKTGHGGHIGPCGYVDLEVTP